MVPGAQPVTVNEDTPLVIGGLATADADAGSGALTATLSVAHGTLTVASAGGAAVSGSGTGTVMLIGTVAQIDTTLSAAGNVVYQGVLDYNGADTLTMTTNDNGNTGAGGPQSDSDTVAITVSAVNDPPVGTNKTVTTLEDTAYTFTAADFGFTDPLDAASNSGANALLAVKITTLPGAGTLTDNNVAVTAGQHISVADINGGHLVFTPAANANGAHYAAFSFQVQDDGGTANGGVDADPSAHSLTFDVTPVNDPPVVGAAVKLSAIGVNSGAHLIAQADLLANASDIDGPTLAAINLQIAKGLGALADNHDGSWTYTPQINDDTSVTFSYQVTDSVAAPIADTATLKINSAQSAPAIGSPGNDTFTAPTGNSTFTGKGGTDTIIFGFKLTDAHISFVGNEVIVDGPTSTLCSTACRSISSPTAR